jgi:hypothetical protein
MRLWTLHPCYLDSKGLVALWREGLLAQAVLSGAAEGYRHHPQLQRFQEQEDPLAAIGAYLEKVYGESQARGYKFDGAKIARIGSSETIMETEGQIMFEWEHLKRKLARRDPDRLRQIETIPVPDPHPQFKLEPGKARKWERGI